MEKANQTYKLELANQLAGLSKLQEKLDQLAGQWDLPPAMVMQLNLALEEAFTNVVNYAYADDEPHTIEIIFTKEGRDLLITIIDDGQPYDPTAKEDPDIRLPAEERKIGGLGIFLIKKVMDNIAYRRENNKNKLVLTKTIPQ